MEAQYSTEGKEFWVGIYGRVPESQIIADPNYLDLFVIVSSKRGCDGTIKNPNTGYSQSFSVSPNSITKVPIPYSEIYSHSIGDTAYVANKGLVLETSDTASVYLGNYQAYSFDAAAVLPTKSLGIEYKVANYMSSEESCFLVVATEDNTEIEFTLSNPINDENTPQQLYQANHPYRITLQKGQTFLTAAIGLLGSTIRSVNCKPIAVFAGNYCPYVPDFCPACDVLLEQMPPLNTWGKSFIINSTINRPTDSRIVIISKEDSTNIKVKWNGVTQSVKINSDEYLEFNSSQNGVSVEADKPIAVTQYAIGATCSGLGDPFMIWINPLEQKIKTAVFSACPSPQINDHYVQIITETSNVSQTILDGQNISSSFNLFPQDNRYSFARVLVSPTIHQLSNPSGFMAYVYGYADGMSNSYESYGYYAGTSLYNIEDVFSLSSGGPLNAKLYFETSKETNSYIASDTVSIKRTVNSQFVSVSWLLNNQEYTVPAENSQPEMIWQLSASSLQLGQNTISMLVHRDCSIDTISANIWLRDASIKAVTNAMSICEGDSVLLQANSELKGNFVWVSNTSDTLPTHPDSVYVKPIVTTKYYVFNEFDNYSTPKDSILVTVYPKVTVYAEDSFCIGGVYRFAGMNLISPGVYLHVFKSTQGCDSTVFLTLKHKAPIVTVVNAQICRSDTYNFEGNMLTEPGIYKSIHRTAINCDSTIELHLKVIEPIYSSITDSFCVHGSYLFGGLELSSPGLYSHTFKSALGCDSIVNLTLLAKSPIKTSITKKICQGGTYIFDGEILSNGGTYSKTYVSTSGCDSIVSLLLQLNPPMKKDTIINICSGSSYLFANQVLSVGGDYSHTFQNETGCDSVVNLHLNIIRPKEATINEEICADEYYQFGHLRLNMSGVYSRTVSSENGCDSIITLNLHVRKVYSSTQTIKILWNESYRIGEHVYNKEGVYKDTLIALNGCDSIVNTKLNVVYIDLPPIIVPKYFTPNGDGINDLLEIKNIDYYPKSMVEIYDRYAKLISRYPGTDSGWDGTYLGSPMPTTDYWYVIILPETAGREVGHFLLKR